MAQNTTVTVTNEWTQLTDADVVSITFQNLNGWDLYVQVTAGATAPSASALGIKYSPGQGEANKPLADLAPGVAGTRVYARLVSVTSGQVWVSHA